MSSNKKRALDLHTSAPIDPAAAAAVDHDGAAATAQAQAAQAEAERFVSLVLEPMLDDGKGQV